MTTFERLQRRYTVIRFSKPGIHCSLMVRRACLYIVRSSFRLFGDGAGLKLNKKEARELEGISKAAEADFKNRLEGLRRHALVELACDQPLKFDPNMMVN